MLQWQIKAQVNGNWCLESNFYYDESTENRILGRCVSFSDLLEIEGRRARDIESIF
jgi:hypothetical protein